MPVASTEATISNEVLRRAFLDSGITANELAVRAGITRVFSAPRAGGIGRSTWIGGDATVVQRDLGLKPVVGKGPVADRLRSTISEERALVYAKALHLDPMDIGL